MAVRSFWRWRYAETRSESSVRRVFISERLRRSSCQPDDQVWVSATHTPPPGRLCRERSGRRPIAGD